MAIARGLLGERVGGDVKALPNRNEHPYIMRIDAHPRDQHFREQVRIATLSQQSAMSTGRTKLERTSFGSFLAGLSALASIWPAPSMPLRYPHKSDADALRGDGIRIGHDMRRVIERERSGAQTAAE